MGRRMTKEGGQTKLFKGNIMSDTIKATTEKATSVYRFLRNNGQYCYTAIEVAEAVGCSERFVARVCEGLIALGLVGKRGRHQNGGWFYYFSK
jgi:predicted transcriptional regulator